MNRTFVPEQAQTMPRVNKPGTISCCKLETNTNASVAAPIFLLIQLIDEECDDLPFTKRINNGIVS